MMDLFKLLILFVFEWWWMLPVAWLICLAGLAP